MFRDGTTRTHEPLPLTRGGPLDALRFLAAFFMVIYHYANEAPVALVKLHPVFERGYLATDFFLVVSGYVMGRIYGERVLDGRVGTGTFFLRRAGRVVPAHLMMCAAFVVFALVTAAVGLHAVHPEFLDWRQLPAQVLLLQTASPFGGLGWNSPSWTLSALLVCYLAFPLMWRALQRLNSPVAVLSVGVLGLMGSDIALQALTGYSIYQTPIWLGAVRAVPMFLMGATLAATAEKRPIPPRVAMTMTVGSFALLAAVQMAGRYDTLSLALISTLVLGAGAVRMAKPSTLLARGALIAFAVFITNEFVRTTYFGAAHVVEAKLHLSTSARWLAWFGGLGAAVGFATAFHYLVDWPSQAFIKPWVAGAPVRIKRWLTRLAPRPDPDFDPFKATGEHAPRVREIVLQIGPMPGAVHRRGLEGPSGLAWG